MKRRISIFQFSIFLALIFFLSALDSHAKNNAPTYKLSYQECLEMAFKKNDELKAHEQNIVYYGAKKQEAHPRGIPIVKYKHRFAPVPQDIDNAGSSFFDGEISPFNNFKVEIGVPITTFGKITAYQELASIGIDAAWHKTYRKRDDIVIQIYKLYQGILLAKKLEELADTGRGALNGKIKELENGEIVDQLQILKLKIALFEVERKVEEAIKKKTLAYAGLKIYLGLEDDVNLILTDHHFAPVKFSLRNEDYFQNLAKSYMPEYKLLEMSIAAKQKELEIEKRELAPVLGMGGFVDIGRAPNIVGGEDESTFTNPFNFTKAGIGLELKGEFDYVKRKARRDQKKAELTKAIYEKRAAIRGLEIKLRSAYIDVVQAKSLMEKAGEEKKAARKMVILTKSNLDLGLGDKKDYFDALQSTLIFEGRELEAVFNYNTAISRLKTMTGSFYPQQEQVE